MRTTICWALAAACGWFSAAWAEDTPSPPRDWSWLVPGKTMREEIERRAGKPAYEWKSVLTKGGIDVRPGPNLRTTGAYGVPLPRVITDPKKEIGVDVLSWTDGAPPDCVQQLVLYEGRLLYAILPPLADETSVTALDEKMRQESRDFQVSAGEGCLEETYLVVEFARERIAWICLMRKGEAQPPAQRLRWCGPSDFAPAFEVEWHIPPDPPPAGPSGSK
jgi:hypothetical protein